MQKREPFCHIEETKLKTQDRKTTPRQFGIVVVATVLSLVIAGCTTTTGGNSALNSKAFDTYQSRSAKSTLASNRKKLVACVTQIAAYQRLNNLAHDITQIEATCSAYETKYRASIMANVRSAWQSDRTVMINSANAATRSLYKLVLERF